MGWTSGKRTLAEAIQECLAPASLSHVVCHHLTLSRDGGPHQLWSIREIAGQPKQRIIIVDLLSQDGPDKIAIKTMDETEGPCYYRVPSAFLDIARDFALVAYSPGWREKVNTQRPATTVNACPCPECSSIKAGRS